MDLVKHSSDSVLVFIFAFCWVADENGPLIAPVQNLAFRSLTHETS
jgi:hypothetical protein